MAAKQSLTRMPCCDVQHVKTGSLTLVGAMLMRVCWCCSYLWVDQDTIAALVVPKHRGRAPERPLAPSGPRISTNIQGSVSQARTYQDLLKNTYDEELFEHHAMSDLVYVKVRDCAQAVGVAAVHAPGYLHQPDSRRISPRMAGFRSVLMLSLLTNAMADDHVVIAGVLFRLKFQMTGSLLAMCKAEDMREASQVLHSKHGLSKFAAQISTGEITRLNDTRMYTGFAPSPDGKFLLVSWMERPFSYNVPCGRFPKRVQVWDR